MTNLSTSEVFEILEKHAPGAEELATEGDITPQILQRLAQTLLKLERAKEALMDIKDHALNGHETYENEDFQWIGSLVDCALSYIEERKE